MKKKKKNTKADTQNNPLNDKPSRVGTWGPAHLRYPSIYESDSSYHTPPPHPQKRISSKPATPPPTLHPPSKPHFTGGSILRITETSCRKGQKRIEIEKKRSPKGKSEEKKRKGGRCEDPLKNDDQAYQ